MDLKDRFKYLMKLNNLSASAFAKKIRVQPSSISHILSGRNKPSLEFVEKVLAHFPNVSADWLINGNTSMDNNFKPKDTKSKKPTPTLSNSNKQIKKIVIFYDDNSFEEIIKQ